MIARIRFIRVALLAGTVTTLLPSTLWSQGAEPSEEYRLKAAFVYRFPQFVEWPPRALNGRESVVICVVRPNPFGTLLRELIAGETLNGRPLTIRDVDRTATATDCHVVFVPRRTDSATRAVLAAIGDRPVLTIGESPQFLDDGGIINMQVIDRRVHFEINASAAERLGLKLSSQLLRLAARVRGA